MKLASSGKTDIGTVRNLNEDSIGMDPENGVFVAADGMGGHSAGEVASKLLVDTVMEYLRAAFKNGTAEKIGTLIWKGISFANEKIHNLSGTDSDKMGMGTTAVVLVFLKKMYHVGWVGDSRLYLFRDGKLSQITRDHSAVQTLVDAGMITEDEALRHPQRNVITRAVGVESRIEVDLLSGKVKAEDIFLVCTDGVSGVLSSGELKKILTSSRNLNSISSMLIESANEKGGRDNSSAILIRVEGS